jgi:hypothetical protein
MARGTRGDEDVILSIPSASPRSPSEIARASLPAIEPGVEAPVGLQHV